MISDSRIQPVFSHCCLNRKVSLSNMRQTPNFLDELLNPDNGATSKKFQSNIRAYNSMFAFTSMGAKVDHFVNNQPGIYVFKIDGSCHHLMGLLLPSSDDLPKFAQLYIYDVGDEASNRLSPFTGRNSASNLEQDVVRGLIKMLDETNDLVKLFWNAKQRPASNGGTNYTLHLFGKRDNDSGQYDYSSSYNVVGLIIGDIRSFYSERDIIVQSYSGSLQRISKLHPKFMAF